MLEPGVKGGSSVKIGRLADTIISELMAQLKLETWSFDFQACGLYTKKKRKAPNTPDQQIDLKLIVLRIAVQGRGVCDELGDWD